MLVRALALFTLSAAAQAQLTLIGPINILPPSPQYQQYFGQQIDADGDRVLVGVPWWDGQWVNSGRAYVFERTGSTWALTATLNAPPDTWVFGRAVDLAGSRLAVSRGGPETVHVFDLISGAWSEVGALTPSSPVTNFGEVVCLAGPSVLVGAPGSQSRVLTFTQTGPFWFQTADLTPPGGVTNDQFGAQMSGGAGRVAISSIWANLNGPDSGAVYIFEDAGSGLAHSQTLTSPAPLIGGEFGQALDLEGDGVIVTQTDPYTGEGRVFVFTRQSGAWSFQQELVAAGSPVPGFGAGVQIRGDIAVVSSSARFDTFRRQAGVWTWKQTFHYAGAHGRAIALTDDLLAGGYPYEGPNSDGLVRVWGVADLPAIVPYCDGTAAACPCGNGGLPRHGCANSTTPSGASLSGAGDASVAHDTVTIESAGTPPNATGLFFQGSAHAGGGNGAQFGDGLRCVGGTSIRLAVRTANGGASSYPIPGDQPISVKGVVPPIGATRFYQLWYRDAASFCTSSAFNLTNGVRIAWTP